MINLAKKPSRLDRREALQTVGTTAALAVASGAGGLSGAASAATPTINASDHNPVGFWPNGARLAVSFSLMFEGGGQPISGAGGVIPDPIEKGVPDLPTNAFFAYGHYEGIPRVLDLMDKHAIKLSSFMIGKAVETSPDIAREIVRRGHEAAAHGRVWDNSYQLSRDEEKRFIADSVGTIQKVTGQKPIGWNAYWMRNSIHILETLQDLGFLYHIDEPSHDEPFIVPVRGRDFVTVPYTFHLNDIVSFPFADWNPAAYEQALRDEFDQLYEEGAQRRRMMVVSLHDRISGHAGRVRVPVTERGRGGNAEHRQPNHFLLTFAYGRDSRAISPTHDWRKIKTNEEAEQIAATARKTKDANAVAFGQHAWRVRKNRNRYHKVVPKPVSQSGPETAEAPVPQSGPTGSGHKVVPLSISRGGGGG